MTGEIMEEITLIVAAAEAVEHAGDAGFVGTLGLDWRLFIAQLVNFGIVLLILWKWVFKPVSGALAARQHKIEESVKKAEEIERARRESEIETERELAKARVQVEKLLNEARDHAESLKTETGVAARAEADRILKEARSKLTAEREQMFSELRAEVAGLTVLATEKLIKQKIDGNKDRELIESLIKGI
jgi:F-type H+-transporting ATPase subunit b